jgi:HEAT repeat protein
MNVKTITPPTWEKLHQLRRRTGFLDRVLKGSEERVMLLEDLAQCTEPAVIPEVTELLFDGSGEVRRATRRTVHQLLGKVPISRLPELDTRMRKHSSSGDSWVSPWWTMNRSDLDSVAIGDHAISILGLASFHNSGHIREAAVHKLAAHFDGSELPFLLIRLNDWVSPIQEAALVSVRARLNADYAGHFLKNLHLVLRLEICGRGAHSALVGQVGALLRSPEGLPFLLEGTASRDPAMRRACLRLAAELDGESRFSILRAGLTDLDPLIRLWTSRRLLSEIAAEELPSLVAALAEDPFMPVRRDALVLLAKRLPEIARPFLIEALADRHASVREAVRFYLGKESGFDAAIFYRERLGIATGAQLVGVVQGLGETGKAQDAELIRPLLAAPEPRHRKAAIFALSRLAPEMFMEDFITALADSKAGVSNAALKALFPGASLIKSEKLFTFLHQDSAEFVRKNALKLVMRLDKWTSLPALLPISCEASTIGSLIKGFLQAWLRSPSRAYATPNEEQRKAAAQALAQASQTLDASLRSELSRFFKELGIN